MDEVSGTLGIENIDEAINDAEKKILKGILESNPQKLHKAIKNECFELIRVNTEIKSNILIVNCIDSVLREINDFDQKIKSIVSIIEAFNNENIKKANEIIEICLGVKTPLSIKNTELISDLYKIQLEIDNLNNDTSQSANGVMEMIKQKAAQAYNYGKTKIAESKLKSKIKEVSVSISKDKIYRQLLFDETLNIIKQMDDVSDRIDVQKNLIIELNQSKNDTCKQIIYDSGNDDILNKIESINEFKEKILKYDLELAQSYNEISNKIINKIRNNRHLQIGMEESEDFKDILIVNESIEQAIFMAKNKYFDSGFVNRLPSEGNLTSDYYKYYLEDAYSKVIETVIFSKEAITV